MLDNFRTIRRNWDKATNEIRDEIVLSASDERGRKIELHVTDNGQVVDLTGVGLNLYWETKDKHYNGLDNFTAKDIKKGIFELYPTTGMLSHVGKLNAWLYLVTAESEAITSVETPIRINRGVNTEAIESQNSFSALTDALGRLVLVESGEEQREEDFQQSQAERTRQYQLAEQERSAELERQGTLIERRLESGYSITSVGKTRAIAHRGLSSIAPDNTLPSYVLAAKAGAWGAETDVQTTSDGKWVLMHDETVDSTTNGTGNVKDLTLTQIKNLKITSGTNIGRYLNLKIPTLEEFLTLCKEYEIIPVVEIKRENYTKKELDDLMTIFRKKGLDKRSVIMSFNLQNLQEIRNRSQGTYLMYLANITASNINAVVDLGNAGIGAYFGSITKENIENAHDYGLLVGAWTVNSAEETRRLEKLGIDFITGNHNFLAGR